MFFCLHNTNHNEVITGQNLNFGKNQPKQTMEFQLTIYKCALHYTVELGDTKSFTRRLLVMKTSR